MEKDLVPSVGTRPSLSWRKLVLTLLPLDLTGSSVDHTDINNIATLVDYSKPLIDYLSKLPENEKLASADILLQESRFLLYGNGKDKPHTGLMFDKQQIKGLNFNQSPSKDIALAAMSMRPIPLAQSWRSSPSPATLFPVKAKTEEESTEKS